MKLFGDISCEFQAGQSFPWRIWPLHPSEAPSDRRRISRRVVWILVRPVQEHGSIMFNIGGPTMAYMHQKSQKYVFLPCWGSFETKTKVIKCLETMQKEMPRSESDWTCMQTPNISDYPFWSAHSTFSYFLVSQATTRYWLIPFR